MKTIKGLPLPDAIVRIAIPTFIELGYDNASMDEVAARAGTTKRTVYAHFGSKEALFRAALGRAVELFESELPELAAGGEPAEELEKYAIRFSDLCTWRGPVRLQRVVMGESERFADLGVMLHRDVIERAEQRIAKYLDGLHAGDRPEGWSRRLASLFLNMTTGRQRFATLLGARDLVPQHPHMEPPPDTDHADIREAVRIFLSGTGLAA